MEPYAEASCCLNVDVRCRACKMGIMEVLGSICGLYNFDMDAEKGLVYVYAVVDPNLLLKALARTGYHAKLKWVKLQHPQLKRMSSSYDYDYSPYGYGSYDDPYRYSRASMYPSLGYDAYTNYPYPLRSGASSYYGSGPYYSGLALPPARYVPSYPPKEYDPYEDEPSISFCSVM